MDMGELARSVLGSFLGTIGFAMLVRVPRRAWLPSGGIAALVYLVYCLLPRIGLSEYSAVFFATLFGSILGHLVARRMKIINTVYLMSAIVPVVPGLGLYRMMAFFGQKEMSLGSSEGLHAMIVIAMMALGLVMSSFLDRLIHKKTEPHEIEK